MFPGSSAPANATNSQRWLGLGPTPFLEWTLLNPDPFLFAREWDGKGADELPGLLRR